MTRRIRRVFRSRRREASGVPAQHPNSRESGCRNPRLLGPRVSNPEGSQKLAGGRAQRYHRSRPPTRPAPRRGARGRRPHLRACPRGMRFTIARLVHLWHPSGMHGSIMSHIPVVFAALDHRLISVTALRSKVRQICNGVARRGERSGILAAILSPLPGLGLACRFHFQGLAPLATACRRSAAEDHCNGKPCSPIARKRL